MGLENLFKSLNKGDLVHLWTNPKGDAKGDRGKDVFGTVVQIQPDGKNVVVEQGQYGTRMNIGKGTRIKTVVKGTTNG